MESGYLYVANKPKFVKEAMISAQSIRQFSKLPICLVCNEELATAAVYDFFDIVILNEELNNYIYLAKIIGMQHSPFEKTIFLDSDTFVCSDITSLFELLPMADIATTQEKSYHTTNQIKDIKFKNIIPEFNSGVILFMKNEITKRILSDWLTICIENNIKNDMPGLREAILKNFKEVRYFILPEEFNSHGYKSMILLYGEVKIIHERMGTRWNVLTPYFLSFEEGKKFANQINKKLYKRLYIPHVGIIPYNWNLYNFIFKIKRTVGIKRVSKNK